MSHAPRLNRSRPWALLLIAALLCVAVLGVARRATAGPATVPATPAATSTTAPKDELPVGKAIVLGIVEGVTEFLPVSSTGHLLVAERLMDVGTSSQDSKDATDAYTVIIQLGAIAAVLLISWRRVVDVLQGVIGKSETGRTLLIALICAFIPAAVVGVALDKPLERHLLKPTPVAIAWIIGGVAIVALASRYRAAARGGREMTSLTPKLALIIGAAQALALWPGVSRSLVTILAGVLVGLSLSAAVEFSFLLGLCTLGAACAYSLLKDGSLVFDRFGTTSPLVGMVVAAVAAAISVKWMVHYLTRHDLTGFAAYRMLAGLATLVLVVTKVI